MKRKFPEVKMKAQEKPIRVCAEIMQALLVETDPSVVVVETRNDPKVKYSFVVRTLKHGCFLLTSYASGPNTYEVLDSFELEEGQKSLRSLKSGEPQFDCNSMLS